MVFSQRLLKKSGFNMETKETPTIVMQEKVKADFEVYLKKHLLLINLKNMLALEFEDYPFEMQQGVIIAYLRDKGIRIGMEEDYDGAGDYLRGWIPAVNGSNIWQDGDCFDDYNIALISAINEGFRIVEEQLKDKL